VHFAKIYIYRFHQQPRHETVAFTLINASVPGISILATCQLISNEAWPVMTPRLNLITHRRPRLLLDIQTAIATVTSPLSPIAALVGYSSLLPPRPLLTCHDFCLKRRRRIVTIPQPRMILSTPDTTRSTLFISTNGSSATSSSVSKSAHQLAHNRVEPWQLEIGITNTARTDTKGMADFGER
jgi:hypothetical protein